MLTAVALAERRSMQPEWKGNNRFEPFPRRAKSSLTCHLRCRYSARSREELMRRGKFAAAALLALAHASVAPAADLGVRGTRLLINQSATKTTIRLSTPRDAGVHKGAAGLPSQLNGTFEVFYSETPGNLVRLRLNEAGAWQENGHRRGYYRGTLIDRLLVYEGARFRINAASLGNVPSWTLNLFSAGAPSDSGGITTILTITNAADSSTHRMCTRFSAADGSFVDFRATRDGGRRLLARAGVAVSCERLSQFRMEPSREHGFFSFPWPNDIRLLPDGSLDMDGFPIPTNNPTVANILSLGASITEGFGTNSAVFFQTTGVPINTGSLPSAAGSTLPGSPVMLVNLDDPGAPRTPVLLNLKNTIGILRPPDLFAVLPYPGHALDGATRYAAILFDGILSPAGATFGPAPLLAELDDPWDASKPVDAAAWAALQAQRDEVFDYVDQYTSWAAGDVVAFTVFTTQDVTRELEAIAAAVEALPSPTPLSRNSGNCSGGALRTTITGQLRLPKWQAGTFPYISSGGEIVIVGNQAVQQSTEDVLLSMTFPCGPAPANGWPILLFMSGTGGGANSSNISSLGASAANPLPYVVASVAPLYSGDRFVPGLPFPYDQPEFLFFNYFNPMAARTNQLQQVADLMYLRRVVEGIQLSAAETGNAMPVETDDSIEVAAGHSQGALTMPQLLAVDHNFDGAFLSAGGGGLYQTILHRWDVRIPLTAVIGPGAAEMDQFHPLPHAVQTFAEIGDAANYARFATSAHILSTSGLIDGCSPVEAISIIGTAMGLDVANPLYYPVFGSASLETPTTTLPVMGNLMDGRTGATVQLDTGHFGTSTNPTLGRSFVDSLAGGGVPEINPAPLLPDTTPGCPRYDPLP
jgi:hypothetical protein